MDDREDARGYSEFVEAYARTLHFAFWRSGLASRELWREIVKAWCDDQERVAVVVRRVLAAARRLWTR